MSKNFHYQPVLTDEEGGFSSIFVENEEFQERTGFLASQISKHSSSDTAQVRLDRRQQRLNTELLNAAIKGDLHAVRRALDEGADINSVCRDSGVTACHVAAHFGHLSLLHQLLASGASPKADFEGRHPIHLAAWNGDESILDALAPGNPDIKVEPPEITEVNPTIRDSWDHDHFSLNESILTMQKGATALHLASQRAHPHCVEYLVRVGASLSARDDRNLTPLDVVGELSEDRPNHDHRVSLDEGPGDDGPQLLRSTHIHFAGISEDDIGGRSNLSDSRSRQDLDRSPDKTHDMMHSILNVFILKGAEPDGATHDELMTSLGGKKMTPLHTAVSKNNLHFVKSLLENDFDATILNEDGLAPIHLAVQRENLEALKILLDGETRRQKLINLTSSMGWTSLHMAVSQEWIHGVSLLLEAGADLIITDSQDLNTVLHLAAQRRSSELLKELLTESDAATILDAKNKTNHTALMISVISGNIDCVETLLNHNADVTVTLPNNVTVIHMATQQGSHSVLELLLRHDQLKSKVLVNSKETSTSTTPLHAAALRGHTECVKCLLRYDANVYAKAGEEPYFGSNALHLASRKGHVGAIKALLDYDRNLVGSVNSKGWFALHIAARFGHRNCVKEIILSGGNLADSVRDDENTDRTAIQLLLWCLPQPIKLVTQLFNSAITVNSYPLSHAKCAVRLHYDLLFPGAASGRQMCVLTGILDAGNKQLQESSLPHPLVETFLHSKWKKLCGIYALVVLIYSLFTVSFTALSMFIFLDWSSTLHWRLVSAAQVVCRFFLSLTFPCIILQELLHARQQQRYYWSDFESHLKWGILGLTSFTLFLVDLNSPYKDTLKHATCFAVLLAWIHLLVLLSRLPNWGLHVLMFFSVARNFIKVFCSFSILLLGFTFAFLIQFEGSAPFAAFGQTLMKVIVMTSELDYTSIVESLDKKDAKANPFVAMVIVVLFIVLVAVVLMNLLIGLAVSDINVLEAQGKSERLGKQVDFLNLIEGFVYNQTMLKFIPDTIQKWIHKKISVPRSLKIYPGRPLDETLPGHLKDSVLELLRSSASMKTSNNEAASTKSYESESDLGEGSDDEDLKALISDVMAELRDIRREIEISK